MRVGVDLGTTHTVVALVDRGNYPVVAFEWGDVTPTLIAARGDELRFGHDAAAVAREPGWQVLRSFKRLLEDAGPETEVDLAGRQRRLLDLMAAFLARLKRDLAARSNAGLREGDALSAAVSVPANASTAQRFLTVEAFRRAGFDVVALLNEPSAAGFEYAHRFRGTLSSRREYVLVYDLGGGTFDASLLHMEGKANEVVTSSGLSRLGGDDFDEAIGKLVEANLDSVKLSASERAQLVDECRLQKEAVTPNTRRFVVDLSWLGRDPVVLPVEQVYEACAPLVEETMAALEPALSAGERRVDWAELAGLYVVGGASSFPPVYRRMRERFGQHRVRRSPHPFGSTAIGLAISLDEAAGWTLTERLTRNLGVFREERAGLGTTFDVLLARDAPLPAEARRSYRAAHNVGHFRFVECARVEAGRPEGNVVLWDEVLVPFDPALRGGQDLARVAVKRLPGEGPLVEERVSCSASGELEVSLALDDGFATAVKIARKA